MRGINRVFIMGTVLGDVSASSSGPDSAETSCEVRVGTRRATSQGETWVEVQDEHLVRFTGQRAQIALRYLRVGLAVAVEGQLRTESIGCLSGGVHAYVFAEQLHLLSEAAS